MVLQDIQVVGTLNAGTSVTNISSPKFIHVKLSCIVAFLTWAFSIFGELPLYFEFFIYKPTLGKPCIPTTCLCKFPFAIGSSITLQYQIIVSKMVVNVSFMQKFDNMKLL